jgi:2-amino-4-hydroxy-6-hydroxymethyldihydropteridine diphosphokinase
MTMLSSLYAIAIGSNRGGLGASRPEAQVRAALVALDAGPLRLLDAAPIITTRPLGPAQRRYANTAALVASRLAPDELLDHLHGIEADFGRTRARRWGPRRLDLDLILWSEGSFAGGGAFVPHPEFRARAFVLTPLSIIAPEWRDPVTGATVRHFPPRAAPPKPVDRPRHSH